MSAPLSRPRRSSSRFVIPGAVAFATVAFAPSALADDAAVLEELRRLRAELDAEKASHAAERAALEKRLAAVEAGAAPSSPGTATSDEIATAVDRYLEERSLFETAPQNLTIPGSGALIDVSVILDATFGTSTATDAGLSSIALGDHDPHVRGANVRNEELVFSADVDPYFYGFLDLVYKLDEVGESAFELEEAYAVTTSLPYGLQAKVGQFFTEFGRTNPTHPHAWEFLDYPVILGRVFGADGWRGQGARMSFIVPHACFPLTILAGFQNARGETQAPFLGAGGESVGAHVTLDRDVANLTDLAYHARIEASRDFGEGGCRGITTALAGVSGGWGPNSTGPKGRSSVYGADLTVKWRPLATDAGWPFLHWMSEAVFRDYRADDQIQTVNDGMGGTIDVPVAARTYEDWGGYSQLVWGFCRPWTVGARIDYAASDGISEGDHWRASGALTYHPSEFGRIRLQVQYDHVAGLDASSPGDREGNVSVWLNFDFSFGKHGAHKF